MNFLDGKAYDKSLVKGARAAFRDILALKKGERVLIVTNPDDDVRQISMALFDAVLELDASPIIAIQKEKGPFDFAEEEVIKAASAIPDVLLSISKERLGKDRFGLKHGYKGKRRYDHIFDYLYEEGKMRSFWSPGITTDIFRRTVPIDYRQLRSDCKKLISYYMKSETVRVTAPGGTDITIGISGRKARPDDGDFRRKGRGGNVPSGEVYISPRLGTANGIIAFDGSIVLEKGEIVIKNPIVCEVKDGLVTSISGGSEAKALEQTVKMGERKAREMGSEGKLKASAVEGYVRNARSIGELGVGLNRKAKIVANMLEDEKVYGTCHFAVGSNYDGDADALIHLDGLVKRPTITTINKGGREDDIMVDGRLVWD